MSHEINQQLIKECEVTLGFTLNHDCFGYNILLSPFLDFVVKQAYNDLLNGNFLHQLCECVAKDIFDPEKENTLQGPKEREREFRAAIEDLVVSEDNPEYLSKLDGIYFIK